MPVRIARDNRGDQGFSILRVPSGSRSSPGTAPAPEAANSAERRGDRFEESVPRR